jgi:CDP-4-dehydro-6-deoxyglucose reductase, E1
MKNILIFPCGSEIGLEIHRALKYNKHFKLIGGSSVEDHGKFVYENYIGGIPFINDENFVERVNELVLNNHIDAIYPTMDSVIVKLMQNKDFIGADIISSELETVEICLSKNKTYKKLASDIKLPLLYDSISSTSEYPVFIKPDVGYGSIGAKKIDDYEQAKQHLRENDKAIISEYLPGEEYSIDCFTDRNGNLLFVGPRIRRRIRNGISVNTITIDDTWGKEEYAAIMDVIDSGRFTMGKKTEEFERKFASYFNSKYAVMVNSGSSANLIAFAALLYSGRLSKGDEVIVPAVSWSTTYYPLFQHGLKLIFVDIDIDTLNIDINQIEKSITDKTKAIFAVNLLGNPNDYDLLKKICNKYGLILIEDNCEALGAKFNNQYTGTFGLLNTFSTFYSHHICTMEGGVVLTDDLELYHYLLSIRAHGWTRSLPSDSPIFQKSENDFYESYNFILPGYNVRPLEIEAAVGLCQIDRIEEIIKKRRENAAYFVSIFGECKNIFIQKETGMSSWFGFSLILKNELAGQREIIVNRLMNNGIEVRPIVAGNFTRNPVIKYLDLEIKYPLIKADYIHNNGFFIGNHSKEIFMQIENVYRVIKNKR